MTDLDKEENVILTKENILQELDKAGVVSIKAEDPETLYLSNAHLYYMAVAMEKHEVKLLIDVLNEIYETMK